MRILLIEDDDRIAQPLAEDLRYQHHVVETVRDGVQGWEYAQSDVYDLILLDVMLPQLDGVELCRRLRVAGYTSLILMITARDTLTDKVTGLDAGADDYLIKPFELEELSARIRALSRRGSVAPQPAILLYDRLQLNSSNHSVTYADVPLVLTPKEYMLLEWFLKNPTQVFTRSMLLNKLWEFDQTSREETVKTHIANLRRKLKAAGSSRELIETIYGIGYRLH